MRYSVLNAATRLYDYYESGEVEPWHAPAPPAPTDTASLGATPEQMAWPLPLGARRVGAGQEAVGRVAVTRRPGRARKSTLAAAFGLGEVEPAVVVAGTVAAMIGGLALLTRWSR